MRRHKWKNDISWWSQKLERWLILITRPTKPASVVFADPVDWDLLNFAANKAVLIWVGSSLPMPREAKNSCRGSHMEVHEFMATGSGLITCERGESLAYLEMKCYKQWYSIVRPGAVDFARCLLYMALSQTVCAVECYWYPDKWNQEKKMRVEMLASQPSILFVRDCIYNYQRAFCRW